MIFLNNDSPYTSWCNLCQKLEEFSEKFERVESNFVNDTLIEVIGKDSSGYNIMMWMRMAQYLDTQTA